MAGEAIPGNPIVTDTYTSDPAVIVHEGTAYLYTGHDEPPDGVDDYVMRDWLCFSSTDLRTWQSHGALLDVGRFTWARGGAKAGAVIERAGRFFWYVAVDHATVPGGAIGVAVADSPLGPFRDALGAALVTNDVPYDTDYDHTIDPSVIVHDGTAHLFWGKERCFSARLDDSMTALVGPITEVDPPGLQGGRPRPRARRLVLPLLRLPVPATGGLREESQPGRPVDLRGHPQRGAGQLCDEPPGDRRVRGEWFFFYHNGVLPGGGSHRRSVCVDRLTYDAEGRMDRVRMTTEGLRTATLAV